jgi:hypothetical protein
MGGGNGLSPLFGPHAAAISQDAKIDMQLQEYSATGTLSAEEKAAFFGNENARQA